MIEDLVSRQAARIADPRCRRRLADRSSPVLVGGQPRGRPGAPTSLRRLADRADVFLARPANDLERI